MTGVMLWLLRSHFADPQNIVNPAIKDFVYRPNETTGITIEPSLAWDPTQVEARPAVYVRRNAWKPNDGMMSIANKYQSRGPSTNTIDNGDRYEIMLTGSHTLFCVGRRGAEVEELGAEVFLRMVEFAPIIRKDFNLHKFAVDEMGESAKLEESSEHFAVPIRVGYAFAHGWLLKVLGPYMKSISVKTQAV